ncbi:MAG: DUF3570 domain-containing protein [Reinekea sp.]
MQLTDNFKSQLTLATTALLGAAGTAQAAGNGDWLVESATLVYHEWGGRITAVEPVLNLSTDLPDDSTVSVHLVFDTLTGSSPNGAAIANVDQTFTGASGANGGERAQTQTRASGVTTHSDDDDDDDEHGGGPYVVSAGDVPLDPNFSDNRFVASLGWEQPFENNMTLNTGATVSIESDFVSLSGNAAVAKDIFNKNTTLSAGLNYEFDVLGSEHSALPEAFSVYSAGNSQSGHDIKQVVDGILGITQVMNRRWLLQMNYSISSGSGYQNDPYKIITVANEGNLINSSLASGGYLYVFEKRPSERLKQSLYLQSNLALMSDDVLSLSYRHMTDDWGIRSHTGDVSYHFQPTEHFYLQPHYRYYRQTAADFYQPFLNSGDEVSVTSNSVDVALDYASSDARLAAFSADSYGITVGFPFGKDVEILVSAEHYQQHDLNERKAVADGSQLAGMDQFTALSASWVQFGFSYRW